MRHSQAVLRCGHSIQSFHSGGCNMRGKSRWIMFLLSLAVVMTIAHDRAQSQAPAPASAAPLQIKQVAYLKASNSHDSDHFGCGGSLPGHIGNSAALSADGNILAIGAHQESSPAKGINGNQNDTSLYASGAVYVYARRGDTWAQQAYLKASNAGQSDNFGLNVALNADGTTMAVAAYWESSAATGINGNQNDHSIPQAGAVYIFTRTGNAWSQQAYIKGSNTDAGDLFGYSVGLSDDGNTLAVGAYDEDG